MSEGKTLNSHCGIEKLKELMDELSEAGFYGELSVKFEAGRIVIVRKTETIKV